MKYNKLKKIAIVLSSLFIASSMFAAPQANQSQKNWALSLGFFGILTPQYVGSYNFRFLPLPYIDLTWRKRLFLSAARGIGGYFWNNDYGQGGASVYYAFGGTNSARSKHNLKGVDAYPIFNIFLNPRWKFLSLRTDFRQDISGSGYGNSLKLNLGIGFPISLKYKIFGSIGPGVSFASEDRMRSYYAISAADSVKSGLPVHKVAAGIEQAGGSLAIVWVKDPYFLNAFTSVNTLVGDAASSPLIKNKIIIVSGLVFSYKWTF